MILNTIKSIEGEISAGYSSNSLSINGTADIKINGITILNDAEVLIAISKGNTITIDPDDKDTRNHFGNQQVYGIVNRLIVM